MKRASVISVLILIFPYTSIWPLTERPTPRAYIKELTLKSRVFGNTRKIRVLLPPGYNDPAEKSQRYPVFYFTDGLAAFDPTGWGLPVVAEELWKNGEISKFIFVGVDNGGSTIESKNPVIDRASEYLPYEDQTWSDPQAPQPKGDLFPNFFFQEVMPLVNRNFRVINDSHLTGLAGSSYGAAVVLYTIFKYPRHFDYILLESPSLHIGNGKLLADAAAFSNWPPAVYLGVGTAEGETTEAQREMFDNVQKLYELIRLRAPTTKTHLLVTENGVHWFNSWKVRLPEALRFLLVPKKQTGYQNAINK